MKKFILLFFILTFQLNAIDIEQQINDALIRDKQKIFSLKLKLSDKNMHTPPSVKLELERVNNNLKIKTKLKDNYVGTAILNKPLVQKNLLRLLNQKVITMDDLQQFQNVVNKEKRSGKSLALSD